MEQTGYHNKNKISSALEELEAYLKAQSTAQKKTGNKYFNEEYIFGDKYIEVKNKHSSAAVEVEQSSYHEESKDSYDVKYNDYIFQDNSCEPNESNKTSNIALDDHNEMNINSTIAQERSLEEFNSSELSDQPVVNDDDLIESSSISSDEAEDEQDRLASSNARKNQMLLSPTVKDEMQAVRRSSIVDNASYESLVSDTKSVTFADEDTIVEYDADDHVGLTLHDRAKNGIEETKELKYTMGDELSKLLLEGNSDLIKQKLIKLMDIPAFKKAFDSVENDIYSRNLKKKVHDLIYKKHELVASSPLKSKSKITMKSTSKSSTLNENELKASQKVKETEIKSKESPQKDSKEVDAKMKSSKTVFTLPINVIEEAQVNNASGDNHFMFIGGKNEKLRIRVKATDKPDDWDLSNKHNFSGLFFHRNEYVVSEKVSNSNSLLIANIKAEDELFANKIKHLRRILPHIAQFETFLRRYFVSFVCLVIDVNMRVVGCFDHKSLSSYPGITVCPPHLERRKKRSTDYQYANLLEVDFARVPKDVFAIVPIIIDSTPEKAKFPEVLLQCNVSVYTSATCVLSKKAQQLQSRRKSSIGVIPKSVYGRRDSYWEEPLQKSSNIDYLDDDEDDAVSVHDVYAEEDGANNDDESSLFSVEKEILNPGKIMQQEDLTNVWTHTDSFYALRNSKPNETGVLFEGILNEIQESQNRRDKKQKITFFEPRSSYIPFAIFRHSLVGEDGTVKWGTKAIQAAFSGVSVKEILQGAVEVLARYFILPLNIIHVEHCINCEKHATTTWHIPGWYDKKFEEFKAGCRLTLPPAIIIANHKKVVGQQPRIGSFEIAIRQFTQTRTQNLFSKLSIKNMPPVQKLLQDLAAVIVPDIIEFDGNHQFELHLYDAYQKKPLKSAIVNIYRVGLRASVDDLEDQSSYGNGKFATPISPNKIKNSVPFSSSVPNNLSKSNQSNQSMQKSRSYVGLPPVRPSSAPLVKKQDNNSFTVKVLTSSTLEDAKFRHSAGFEKVMTWGKDSIAKWLLENGATDEVVAGAFRSGVVDGPTLIALGSSKAFQSWGMKNRIKLVKLERAFNELVSQFQISQDNNNSKDTEVVPLSSTPVAPTISRDNLYTLVTSRKSDSKGIVLCSVNVAGAYVVSIEGSTVETFHSTVLKVNGPGRTGYCTSLNPKLGLAKITIILDGEDSQNNPDQFSVGVILAVVNIQTGRRHIGHAKIVSNESMSMADARRLTRTGSVGQILVSGISAKLKRTSIMSSPTASRGKHMTREYDKMESLMWLPYGTYYSEIDGSIFKIDESKQSIISSSWRSFRHEGISHVEPTVEASVQLNYTEAKTWKCHQRLIMSSVKGFQKIYRRYKKAFLTDNLWAYLSLKKGLRRFLVRIRQKIQDKYVTKLQAWQRARKARQTFVSLRRSATVAQSMIRVHAAKIKFAELRYKKNLIKKHILMYYLKRKGRRHRMALRIQCAYRSSVARREVNILRLRRKIERIVRRWIEKNRNKIRSKKAVERRKQREAAANIAMMREEEYMRKFLVDEAIEIRRRLERKIQRAAQMKNNMSSKIQATYRGYFYRKRAAIGLKALVRLQKIFRLRQYEKKAALNVKIKYVPGFPALAKHKQLLGATKLLLGIYPLPTLQAEPSQLSYTHEILFKVLNGPATKIQSVMKMYRDRCRYIYWWKQKQLSNHYFAGAFGELESQSLVSLGNQTKSSPLEVDIPRTDYSNNMATEPVDDMNAVNDAYNDHQHPISDENNENWLIQDELTPYDDTFHTVSGPPLYRYLIQRTYHEEDNSLLDEHTVYSTDDARYAPSEDKERPTIWDNGSNKLLEKLGYVRLPSPEIQANSPTQVQEHVPPTETSPPPQPQTYSVPKYERLESQESNQENFDTMVQQFKGLFMAPSKRLISKFDNKFQRAAIKIQAIVRGSLVRKRIQRERASLALAISLQEQRAQQQRIQQQLAEKEDDQSIQSLVSFESAMFPRQFSNIGTSFKTLKSSLSRTLSVGDDAARTVKTLKRGLSSGINKIVEQVQEKADVIKTKYQQQQEEKKLAEERMQKEKERRERIFNCDVNIEDGILNFRGTSVEGLPRLNRKWFLATFPYIDETDLPIKNKETVVTDSFLEYEMTQGRCIGESSRTVDLSPFSKETLHNLNYNIHLADICKYKRVLVTIFLEAGEEGQSESVRPDAVPTTVSLPGMRTYMKKKATDPQYIPAFHGSIQLNGAKPFTPCGGRMIVTLKPNPSEAIFLSKAQARRLALLKKVELVATLIPVAIPSANFIQSLRSPILPSPTYPSEILDACLFEKFPVDLSEFYGAAICMTRFKGRNFVSTRHRGFPFGILEFNDDGKYLQKVTEARVDIETVVIMIPSLHHLACCGCTGNILMTREVENSLFDFKVIIVHPNPIEHGCSLHRAGIDIFFTCDKNGYIGIVLMENNICIRVYLNEPFLRHTITGMVCGGNYLYLSLNSGEIKVIHLTDILQGNVEAGKNLMDNVIYSGSIFKNSAPITSIAILSQGAFFGLVNIDDVMSNPNATLPTEDERHVTKKGKSSLLNKKIRRDSLIQTTDPTSGSNIDPHNPRRPAPLEGHILIVGGGDGDPCLKMLCPLFEEKNFTGFRELQELKGFSKAITHIVTDAAGRYIIAGSQGSRVLNVYNALTFNIEKSFDNFVAAYIGLGHNTIFLCSFKAPFITILKTVDNDTSKARYRKKQVTSMRSFDFDINLNEIMKIEPDGRPAIAMRRSYVWCTTSIAGGRTVPTVSTELASDFLGFGGKGIVDFWRQHYDQGVQKVIKLPEEETKQYQLGDKTSLIKATKSASTNSLKAKIALIKSASVISASAYLPPTEIREEEEEVTTPREVVKKSNSTLYDKHQSKFDESNVAEDLDDVHKNRIAKNRKLARTGTTIIDSPVDVELAHQQRHQNNDSTTGGESIASDDNQNHPHRWKKGKQAKNAYDADRSTHLSSSGEDESKGRKPKPLHRTVTAVYDAVPEEDHTNQADSNHHDYYDYQHVNQNYYDSSSHNYNSNYTSHQVEYYYDEHGNPYYYDEYGVAHWYYSAPFAATASDTYNQENLNTISPTHNSYAPVSEDDHNQIQYDFDSDNNANFPTTNNQLQEHSKSLEENEASKCKQQQDYVHNLRDFIQQNHMMSSCDASMTTFHTLHTVTEDELWRKEAAEKGLESHHDAIQSHDEDENIETSQSAAESRLTPPINSINPDRVSPNSQESKMMKPKDSWSSKFYSVKQRNIHFSDSDDDEELNIFAKKTRKAATIPATPVNHDSNSEADVEGNEAEALSVTSSVINVEEERVKVYQKSKKSKMKDIISLHDDDE